MFGAIYIGLSGLNAYSRGLQQVSGNVTNLNTAGFKGTTVTFRNYYGTGDGGGLNYTVDTQRGGGGVSMGDPLLDLAQGELRQSERDLDLAVDGTGFLTLLDGDRVLYARTGSFEVDKDGFIVLAGTSHRLATLDSSNRPVALSIDTRRTSAPKPTTTIKLADNLSSSGTTFTLSDLKVYDSAGGQHVWRLKFDKDTSVEGNGWKLTVTDDKSAVIGEHQLRFDTSGDVVAETEKITVTDSAAGFSVTLDFSQNVTSFSAGETSTLRSASIDGFGVGALTAVAVNDKGELELRYSNEQKVQLGAVAIADFRVPQDLEQRGNGLFEYSGSGERRYLASEDVRVGRVLGRRLEASNVDLSKQFGELILIQRGFQASSQVISVSNDMIQQLFGIRGQG